MCTNHEKERRVTHPNRQRGIRLLVVLVTATLAACAPKAEPPGPADVAFSVDPTLLGPPYENSDLGITYRPPLNWDKLSGPQRQAVLDALAASERDSEFVLEVEDVFFDTNSMSFASIATVRLPDGQVTAQQYDEAFAATLGLPADQSDDENSAIAARMDFTVNNVPVVQFRHLQSERVTFTLVFTSSAGQVIQLDYSIPTDEYKRESVKLESSIGTLRLIPTS